MVLAIAYFCGVESLEEVSPVFKLFILDQLKKAQTTNGCWYARDLQEILNYSAYSRFAGQENKKSILKAACLFVENSDRHFKPCDRDGNPDWELDAIACMAILKECRNRASVIVAKEFFRNLSQGEETSTDGISPFDAIRHVNQNGVEPTESRNVKKNNPLDAIRRYEKKGHSFWTVRELMDLLDIDSFAFFEDRHDSLISNAIAECQDCGFNAESEFRKKYLDWELSSLACYFVLKRFDDLRYPKVKEAQEYFGYFKKNTPAEPVEKVKQTEIIPFPKPTDTINPFEAIRHNYPNGMEFWTARELMKLLKIRGFEMFREDIPNSIISQAMTQYEAESLGRDIVDIKYQFCKKEKDWELTAIACYLIFIRVSRVTYPEVEKALRYFAREVGRSPSPDLKVDLKIVPNNSSAVDTPLSSQKNQELGVSPFDAIRRYDKDGNEYWSARELIEFMGYSKWQNFETPVQEAIENIKLTGDEVEAHIMIDHKMVYRPQGGGRSLSDYKLSRYGCYMIALCCDHRKSEVAMAKKYFAIQTRKAELIEQREADEGKLKISDEEALKMAMECLEISGVAQPVVSQFKMRQLAKLDPAHKEIYESVCGALASSYTLENKPILVTKVGQMICDRLGLNRNIISFAKTVNQKLIEIGMQEKDIRFKENKPYNKGYVLTKAGEPWAIVENPTDSEGRVRPQIKYNQQLYLSNSKQTATPVVSDWVQNGYKVFK